MTPAWALRLVAQECERAGVKPPEVRWRRRERTYRSSSGTYYQVLSIAGILVLFYAVSLFTGERGMTRRDRLGVVLGTVGTLVLIYGVYVLSGGRS